MMGIRAWVSGKFWARVGPTKRARGNGLGDVFFHRYTVFKTPVVSCYLHEFLRSDEDRCPHDHPWPFLAIILRGGYWEQLIDGSHHWRRPGSVLLRRATFAHRVSLDPGTRSWSLVFTLWKMRDWGFHTLVGWKPWVEGDPNPICETDDPRLLDPATFDGPEEGSGEFPQAPPSRVLGAIPVTRRGYSHVEPADVSQFNRISREEFDRRVKEIAARGDEHYSIEPGSASPPRTVPIRMVCPVCLLSNDFPWIDRGIVRCVACGAAMPCADGSDR